ncbi:MAG: menaquinone biosynthesis protein [Verrucomicrobiales bacterium]
MQPSDDMPKLRMAPPGEAGDMALRHKREQSARDRKREFEMQNSLHPFRVGSVPYLNAIPLTRGLEDQIELIVPSQLGLKLQSRELDAALLSITEVLFNESYDILDGIAIASLGEVQSVFLAHRGPLNRVREVYCDPASLTSVNLLKVLLAEQNLFPEFKPLPSYDFAILPDYTLLIGDVALNFIRSNPQHEIYDLGHAWYELTKLPFVYAVWALRNDIDTTELRRLLREARDFGMDTLDHLINTRTEFDRSFRKDYLTWHIHYHLGSDEKRGIAKFVELLRKHSGREVFDPRYQY